MEKPDQPLDRATAAEYARWFKALADATRIQIVSLLARRGTPMNVGEIVAAVDVGQSTVSAHLKVLAEVRFLLAEHRGAATCYWINDACVDCFGAAAYPDADGAPEAALRASLGCGNPVAVASLNPGETVLDLGSGGGLDVLLSARRVGPAGTAYGLDASPDMLALARAN